MRSFTPSRNAARAIAAGVLALVVFGAWQLGTAKFDALPEFSPPTVEVQTEALGLSAEEVEQLITVPLEQDLLAGVAWLDTIRSQSVPGLSVVQLVFERGTDLYRARQVVQERISQAAGLPNVSKPPQMLQPRSSTSRAAMIGLSSAKLTSIQLGVLARWTIRPRLLAVPGVSNVAIWGQRERQLQVLVDPLKLAASGVGLDQVISTAGNALWVSPLTFLEASTPGTGGYIDTAQQRLGIQHNLPIITPEDLAKVAIDDTGALPLALSDVATVVEDHQPLIGDAVVENEQGRDGFLVVVEKRPGANTRDVTRGVEHALTELKPGLSGVAIDTSMFRPAGYVDNAVRNVRTVALWAAGLLLVALAALWKRWRPVVVAAVSIGVAVVTTATVLRLADRTFDALTLAGLVVALAIIVYDTVATVRALSLDPDSAASGFGPAAWATVAFGVAVVPVFVTKGLPTDSFLPTIAGVALLGLVVSLAVTRLVTPALGELLLTGEEVSPPRSDARDRIAAWVSRAGVAIAVTAVAVVAAVAVVPRLSASVMPHLRDPNLIVKWAGPYGTSLSEMDRITARAHREFARVPGVERVATHVGQASLGDQAVGSDAAETWISLDSNAHYDKTVATIRRIAAGYPGMGHRVVTRAAELLATVSPRTNDITVRVYGQNLGELHTKAEEIRARLEGIAGVRSAHVDTPTAAATMQVQVDIAKATAAGLRPGDVRRAAATLLSGLRVGNLFEDQKVFDVVVWATPAARSSVNAARELLIDSPIGGHVRLADVADVSVEPTPPVIHHEGVSRYVDVAADVSGRNVPAVARRVHADLVGVEFPNEYHAELLGDYAERHDARRGAAGLALAAAAALILLFQAATSSWRAAFIVFASTAFALAGGVIAAGISGQSLTVASAAGLLAVGGIATRASLRFAAEREESSPFSVLAVAALLLPIVVLGDAAGLELLRPLAIVLLGGLAAIAVATTFFLPALHARFAPAGAAARLEIDDERLRPVRIENG